MPSKQEQKIRNMRQELSRLHQEVKFLKGENERLRVERDNLKQRIKDLRDKLYPEPNVRVRLKDRNPPANVRYFRVDG